MFWMERYWYRQAGNGNVNNDAALPSDFVFGGTAVATNNFEGYEGPFNLVAMDDAFVMAGTMPTSSDYQYRKIVACNGGVLSVSMYPTTRDVYFAFNGGMRRQNDYDGYRMFGDNSAMGNNAWVRIYENGGAIEKMHSSSFYLPHLKAPVGNVVQTVEMTDELAGKVFQTPPAVVITDATGAGSNAVAIVDYDFDAFRVTNITVVCRGENFSGGEGDVTAQLYLNGAAQLSTPLACTVGTCDGGPVTFSCSLGGGNVTYSGCTTNTYRGLTVIDMDADRSHDHSADNANSAGYQVYVRDGGMPQFASTGIVVRSGCFGRDYVAARPNITNYFHSLDRIEFRGGYFYGFEVNSITNIVVGGETWLTPASSVDTTSYYAPILTIPSDGTLTVDTSCLANGVTPALKYGRSVNFADGAKVAVEDWELIPQGRSVAILDLSGVTSVTGAPAPVQPDAGVGRLTWDAADRKLYAKRYVNRFLMIFR